MKEMPSSQAEEFAPQALPFSAGEEVHPAAEQPAEDLREESAFAPQWVPLPPPPTQREKLLYGWRRYGLGGLFILAVLTSGALLFFQQHASHAGLGEAELSLLAMGRNLPVQSTSLAPGEGGARLSITSAPEGATVLIDFDSVGVTPLREHSLPSGVYVLSVRKPQYASLDTVIFVNESAAQALTFLLEPNLAPAEAPPPMSAAPPRVQAASERRPAETVQAPEQIRAQRLPETAAAEPARPARQRPEEVRSSSATLGMLLVTSEPSEATVLFDGSAIGTTPLLFQEAAAGRHEVVIRKTGYEDRTMSVYIDAGQTAKVSGQLKALFGSLVILVQPWGSIYIDEQLHKRDTDVQYVAQLPVGSHRVRAVHPTLGTWERVVHITGGTPQQFVVHFNPPAAEEKGAASPAAAPGSDTSKIIDEQGIYVVAEEPPQPIGGMEGLHREARYPVAAYNAGLEGRVFLQFVVDEEGRVHNPKVTRGLGMGCDEEALRVIEKARFTPGKVGGKPVKVHHALFLNFQIRKP